MPVSSIFHLSLTFPSLKTHQSFRAQPCSPTPHHTHTSYCTHSSCNEVSGVIHCPVGPLNPWIRKPKFAGRTSSIFSSIHGFFCGFSQLCGSQIAELKLWGILIYYPGGGGLGESTPNHMIQRLVPPWDQSMIQIVPPKETQRELASPLKKALPLESSTSRREEVPLLESAISKEEKALPLEESYHLEKEH